ncbi:MAG: hypothetical protein ACI8TF_000493 [Paracoccaceae bacterium]|jgi:hypothetical protein
MPTGPKLAGAVLFALVAYIAAIQVVNSLPEGSALGYFIPTIVVLGVLQGWIVMGRVAGNGWRVAIGGGVRTSVQIAFWGVVIFSLEEMFERSTRLRYDGPGEAAMASIDLFIDFGWLVLTVPVAGTLLIGGAIAGLITEYASRHWI